MTADVDETNAPPLAAWLLWLVGVPGIVAIGFRIVLHERPDYLGHYLAGHGASLAAAWCWLRLREGRPVDAVAAAFACIGLGWLVEATLFPLGGFDWLDFDSQSLGAVLAGLALLRTRAGDPATDWPNEHAPLTRNANGRLVIAVSITSLVLGVVLAFS